MSAAHSRRRSSVMRGDYLTADEEISSSFMYPHLQVSLFQVNTEIVTVINIDLKHLRFFYLFYKTVFFCDDMFLTQRTPSRGGKGHKNTLRHPLINYIMFLKTLKEDIVETLTI